MSISIDDFYGIATYQPGDEYPNSWRQIAALKVETKICQRIWDDEDEFTVKEVGNMKLYKLNKHVDLLRVSDSISGDDAEVGVAIESVLNPKWDEVYARDMDKEGNP